MSFDTKLPDHYAELKKEASALYSQAATLETKIDSGQAGGGCDCSCSACDDCEERDYLSDDEVEELEAELKPIAEKLAGAEATLKRLERYAKRRRIALKA